MASTRKLIDEVRLPKISDMTRWEKCVPIKVNILAWKIRSDALPTQINISRRVTLHQWEHVHVASREQTRLTKKFFPVVIALNGMKLDELEKAISVAAKN
nr:RNA-directed DNA polymerase, eukaryota [Tanacetum cinerariifolium]